MLLLILFLHLIYGATFTVSKILIAYAPPILTIGIRMTIAGIILLGISSFAKNKKVKYNPYVIINILALGFFGIFLPYALRYWSLKYLTVFKTALIYNLSPFISFIFSATMLSEKLTFRKFLGMTIGFLGILPIMLSQDPTEASLRSIYFISWAEIGMIVSVSSFCFGWVILKKFLSKKSISSFALNGRTMIIGGIFSLITSILCEGKLSIQSPIIFSSWLILIIIMTNIICFYLYSYLLKKYSATLISLGGLLSPISAGFTSWLLLGEKATVESLFSCILIVIGFLIFYYEEIQDQIKS